MGSLDNLVGQVLAARYRVDQRLGSGAMGTVFRAVHVKVGRRFAIKVLHPGMLVNEKYLRRFEREAELSGKLHHPNVAGVVDVGVTADRLRYLVMEYADGPVLSEPIAEGPMAAPRVIQLVRQLCDGLHHAHEHGLIHRDFKPDNVIVERDPYGTETPRILDFGIAISLEDTLSIGDRERLTTGGIVLGTPHYMAPEHLVGGAIDHRIDLFALGVICYEMLAGRLPFDGDGVEVARANLNRATPPMSARAPAVVVDPLLEAFTHALMTKSRDARLPSAKAARDLLDLIEHDRPAAAQVLGVTLHKRTLGGTAPPLVPRSQPPVAPRSRPPAAAPDDVSGPIATVRAVEGPPLVHALATPLARSQTIPVVAHQPVGSPSRRHLAIAAGAGCAVIAVAVAVLALRGTRAVPEAPAIVLRGPAEPAPVRERVADERPPAAIADVQPTTVRAATTPPIHAPTRAARAPGAASPARPQLATPAPPVATETPRLVPDAAAIAQLYGSIGRDLKRLDQTRGLDATYDLWPRYRMIRINDAIARSEIRVQAQQLLQSLQVAIAARSR